MPRAAVLSMCWLAACYSANPAANVPCSGQDFACPKGQSCDFGQVPPTCVTMIVDAGAEGSVAAGCTADADCPAACEEGTGKCVDGARVLWVDGTKGDDAGTCTEAAPCETLDRAIELADDQRDFIRVEDGDYRRELTIPKKLTISGTGPTTAARLSRASFGPAIQVNASGTLTIEMVRIVNVPVTGITSYGSTTVRLVAFESNNRGIEAQQGSLVVNRALFTNHTDWAIRVNGATHAITNAVFAENARGVLVDNNQLSSSTISHCTFVKTTNDDAIRCQGIAPPGVTVVTNSVFSDNQKSLDTRCTATFSLFTDQLVPGNGNKLGPAGFVGPSDLHLADGSQAIDSADPASTEPVDFDGVARPRGPLRDMGAFEH